MEVSASLRSKGAAPTGANPVWGKLAASGTGSSGAGKGGEDFYHKVQKLADVYHTPKFDRCVPHTKI